MGAASGKEAAPLFSLNFKEKFKIFNQKICRYQKMSYLCTRKTNTASEPIKIYILNCLVV